MKDRLLPFTAVALLIAAWQIAVSTHPDSLIPGPGGAHAEGAFCISLSTMLLKPEPANRQVVSRIVLKRDQRIKLLDELRKMRADIQPTAYGRQTQLPRSGLGDNRRYSTANSA